jgi:WD40 repeat protein
VKETMAIERRDWAAYWARWRTALVILWVAGAMLRAWPTHGQTAVAEKANDQGSGGKEEMIALSEGKLMATLEGHGSSVYALAMSPDGKLLASGSDDHTVKLWSLPEGKVLATLEGHGSSV